MSTIWVDYVTPKQVLYFLGMVEKLEERGDRVISTTRKYREVNELMKLKNVQAKILGRHGGKTLKGKLVASGERVIKLAEYISKFNVDVLVSFCLPEAVRVAYGLQIPIINIYDSPHAEKQTRLVSTLINVHISPKYIPRSEWIKLGFRPEQLVFYDAIDPAAWLKGFIPDRSVVKKLGLAPEKRIVTVRTEEAFASYLLGKTSDENPLISPLIEELLRIEEQIQIVVLCRYGRQRESLLKRFERIIIPRHVVDAASLISQSTLFIGGGGTMTTEAALLGVPTISFFPGRLHCEDPLIREKLLYHPKTVEEGKVLIEKILSKPLEYFEKNRARAKKLLNRMENPTDTIIKVIDRIVEN